MPSLGLALGLPFGRVSSAALTPTLFVDSVNGDDFADGRSAETAVQTLTTAASMATNDEVIGLAYGSYWLEALDVQALTGVTIVAYGNSTLAVPEISGLGYVASGAWYPVDGYSKVYQAPVDWEDAGGRLRVYVMMDGEPGEPATYVQLTGVADLAECEATNNSFVRVNAGVGTSISLYVNYEDGTSPSTITGGQIAYTARTFCIYAGNNTTIAGPVVTGIAINNNGSTDLVARNDCMVRRTLGYWGSKHNLGMGDGTMEDCIAIGADGTTADQPSNAAHVAFLNDGTGKTAAFKRCGVLAHGVGFNSDYVAHGNPTSFDSVTIEQAWTVVTGNYGGSFATLNQGSYYHGVPGFPGGGGTSKMLMVVSPYGDNGGPTLGYYGPELIEDCVVLRSQVDAGNNNGAFRILGTYPVEISHCSMYCDTSLVSGAQSLWIASASSTSALNMHHSVMFNGTKFMLLYSGQPYTGDYNVFIDGTPGETRTVFFDTYAHAAVTLAVWQADSGQDANSVYLARADQARGNGYAFWLGVANDENDGPVDGDWRINPSARVYSGANVAYIGTFPDSTPITQAGPQNHWDWNARASAAGAPTSFPVVPSTLAEAKTYINNPRAWDFYP